MENDIKIMAKARVCEDANLQGDITIGSGCVIHPSASIIAQSGPIILGDNCIVEEYSTILHRIPSNFELQSTSPLSTPSDKSENDVEEDQSQESSKLPVLKIGSYNVFEVGCMVQALKIGDRNVFECKSFVSPYVTITNGCIIGAGCKLEGKQILQENTVVHGTNCLQREAIDKEGSHTIQLDFLWKVLPNYHHMRKPNYDPKNRKGLVS